MFSIIRNHPKAVLWAIGIHVVFIIIFGVSFSFFNPRMLNLQDSDVIRAVTVDPVEVEQKKIQQEKKKKAEQKRKQEEKKRREAERKKKIALKKKKEAEAKERRRKKLAEEKKQRELELKRQLEEEEKLRQEQAKREEELRKEMEAENAKLAAERRKQQLTIIDKHKVMILKQIQRNWNIPAVAKPDMVCKIKVQLIPSGEVINMRIVSSSGNRVYDDSVERAIKKSSPLPLPPPEYNLFDEFREITFRVSPQNIN